MWFTCCPWCTQWCNIYNETWSKLGGYALVKVDVCALWVRKILEGWGVLYGKVQGERTHHLFFYDTSFCHGFGILVGKWHFSIIWNCTIVFMFIFWIRLLNLGQVKDCIQIRFLLFIYLIFYFIINTYFNDFKLLKFISSQHIFQQFSIIFWHLIIVDKGESHFLTVT